MKRLAEDGLIESAKSADAKSPDARRQYFKLTRLGRQVIAAEAARLERLVNAARNRKLYPGSA